jgi:MFS family permease
VQSAALVVASPLAGRLSDKVGRRKVFVAVAALIYSAALLLIATAGSLHGYLVGMTISGLGFGMYMAVDLALVVDVLPATGSSAKDLGVLNIAGALPFALAPAFAPAVLALGGGKLHGPLRRGRRLRRPRSARDHPGQGRAIAGCVRQSGYRSPGPSPCGSP